MDPTTLAQAKPESHCLRNDCRVLAVSCHAYWSRGSLWKLNRLQAAGRCMLLPQQLPQALATLLLPHAAGSQTATPVTAHPTHLQAAGGGVLLLQLLPQALDFTLRVGQVTGLMSQLPSTGSCCVAELPALLGQVLHLSLQCRVGCRLASIGAALLPHLLMWVCVAALGRDGPQAPSTGSCCSLRVFLNLLAHVAHSATMATGGNKAPAAAGPVPHQE